VSQMLAAGVDVRGVNGMTMNYGVVSAQQPVSELVLRSAEALHTQVRTLWEQAGRPLGPNAAWSRVGLTPMVGQSDVPTEQLTLADAAAINVFARDKGVGLVSMWSLNRDASCTAPQPTVLAVVQTSCSGIDQGQARFAEVLAADLPYVTVPADDAPAPAPSPSAPATPVGPVVDDPLTSPFPIWDPLGTYPGGTKIVWQKQVYQAKWWTSGVSPDQTFANPYDSPWTLLGPVLPGDRPAPLPTLPAGTYPQWDPLEQYTAGTRVQHGVVPYEAKWWSQGQEPGVPVAGGSPWVLIHMG